MGVSLYTITGHSLDYKGIIELQNRLESDEELLHLYKWKKDNYSISPWTSIATAERLEAAWKHNQTQKEIEAVFLTDELSFPTFFGEIHFDRNLVTLNAFGQKLWILESNSDLRAFILNFNNRIAQILGQKKIIYFGDSSAKSSWIDNWMYGKTIDQIEEKIFSLGNGKIKDIDTSIKEEHLYIQTTISS